VVVEISISISSQACLLLIRKLKISKQDLTNWNN
jgi:hypothetical protein